MVDVQFKGKTVPIPSTLEELSPDQYKGYLFLTVVLKRGIIEEDGFKAKLMGILLGLKADITDYTKEIAAGLIAQLDKLDGFFIDDNGTRTPATSTGRNLLPEFAGWKAKVGDMLNGMTFGDFVEAVGLMGEIHDNGEDGQEAAFKDIARLMYERAEPYKEPAEPYKGKGETLQDEPPVLLAIHAVTLFTAVFNQLTTDRVVINGQAIDFSLIFKSVPGLPTKPDDKTGWLGIAMEVASSGVFGPMKAVNDSPLWDVLLYLYRCKFDLFNDKTLRR
jgi:hypothetical protein